MTKSQTNIKLPLLISDGMVLQRNTQVKVWGWAIKDEILIVKFLDKEYQTKVNTKGEW